ncbi:MAG TPA: hypothetical protein VGI63_07995 [Verrucomicrobiae bacterium]
MKTMNLQKNIASCRFAACADGVRLVKICVRAAGRAPASKSVSKVHLSAGGFHGGYTPGSRHKINLTRCEIFRGKVSRRKNQKQNIASKTSTHLLETYE